MFCGGKIPEWPNREAVEFLTEDLLTILDRMSIAKASLTLGHPSGIVRWRRDSRRQSRFALWSLGVAALAVAGLWGVWRYSLAAAGESPAASDGPMVRVGIVPDATHLRLVAYGGFDIFSSAGRAVFTCAGQNVLRFSASGSQPGTFYYYVVVVEFDKRQKPQARRMLTQLREMLKVGMELLETSERLVFPGNRPALPDRLFVAVGPFDDLNLADQWRQYLVRTYQAYIIKDASQRATGEIHLYDHTDRLLARMKDSVMIRPKDPKQLAAVEALPSVQPGWPTRSVTSFRDRGAFEIRLNNHGRLVAINTLPMEEYVKGVVPSEIGGSSPYESQKAQAIAARSEAYHKLALGHHLDDLYDFCDKVHCQTYHGVEDQTPASLRAVEETRGQVLVYENQVIDAVYCHSCGGVSAASTDVWRSGNYAFYQTAYDRRFWRGSPNLSSERQADVWLSSAPDVFCNPSQRGFPEYARKYFRWTRTLDGATLERLINHHQKVGQILDIQVVERTESGRVRVLRVVGSKQTVRFTGIDNVSAVFNDPPSSFFALDVVHDPAPPNAVRSVTLRGGGFGHGVGLCQMGAYMMALRGYGCEEILAHYYPKTLIRRAY